MLHIIDFCRDDQELLDHYKTSYAVDRRLDRGQMVGVAGRATKILTAGCCKAFPRTAATRLEPKIRNGHAPYGSGARCA